MLYLKVLDCKAEYILVPSWAQCALTEDVDDAFSFVYSSLSDLGCMCYSNDRVTNFCLKLKIYTLNQAINGVIVYN